MATTDSTFVEHCECPKCGSSDAGSLYTDGHVFCFVCDDVVVKAGGEIPEGSQPRPKVNADVLGYLERGVVVAHPKRGLTQSTCTHWNYRGVLSNGDHLAVYCDAHGTPLAIKVRHPDKTFTWIGDSKAAGLYGRHLWGQGGKMVVITEGEIDALSVSQAFGNKFAVVSVKDGAQSAPKSIAKEMEWLSTYERVVFMLDQDEPGRKAAQECARLLPPGKAYIARLSMKDANDLLTAGKQEEITRAAWNAQQYRPDGIVNAKDLIQLALAPPTTGLSWPWQFLTDWTYGRRYGEAYTFGAGTGIGKTDAIDELVAHTLSVNREGVAVFSYERGPVKTLKAVAGKFGSRRFHIPDPEQDHWTQDELLAALNGITAEFAPFYLNDHFGSCDWPSVKERIRYLRHAENIRHFFIDPVSAMVIGADDERKALDQMFMEGQTIAAGLDLCIYWCSHLTRPDFGPSHEEGGKVQLKQFRGSNGIGMFSAYVFGLERNQQADDPAEQTRTLWRCVKDRYTGDATGKTYPTYYNRMTGRLEELQEALPDSE